jgi:single-stranded DNA-specific DHH superfamily exonuclease
VKIRGAYASGDLARYAAAGRRMRADLEALRGRVLVAHHGDCDGITGAAFVGRFLTDRGVEVVYASAPEFRGKDLGYFSDAADGCAAGVFVEAQGMPPEYSRLDSRFLNIDHHPHPSDTPIRRMFNPRDHDIEPNPAIGLVTYELFGDALPAAASYLAALASIVDYCPEPARPLIAADARELERLDDLRDTFLASQYVLPHTTGLAGFLSRIPAPEEFLAAEPYAARRNRFREMIASAVAGAAERRGFVIAETEAGEYRIASPLANRLQDLHPSKCVVVVEVSGDTARLSVRNRRAGIHLGAVLGGIARSLGAGDGTGHEKAGSARIPVALKAEFLKRLEEHVG